jgi:hypothetical protein
MSGFWNILVFGTFWLLLALATYGTGLILLGPYFFLVINHSENREARAIDKLNSTLMKQEKVIVSGIQKRVFALWSRRDLVAITNSRMIKISRSLFGGFSMLDYQWKDLHDARFSENIIPNFFGAKVYFVGLKGVNIEIDGLPSSIASAIYSHAQAQEQEWEEKNRIRALEDKRAMSGASIVQVGNSNSDQSTELDIFARLEQAKKLYESGVLSDVEFHELKSKIINKT